MKTKAINGPMPDHFVGLREARKVQDQVAHTLYKGYGSLKRRIAGGIVFVGRN